MVAVNLCKMHQPILVSSSSIRKLPLLISQTGFRTHLSLASEMGLQLLGLTVIEQLRLGSAAWKPTGLIIALLLVQAVLIRLLTVLLLATLSIIAFLRFQAIMLVEQILDERMVQWDLFRRQLTEGPTKRWELKTAVSPRRSNKPIPY